MQLMRGSGTSGLGGMHTASGKLLRRFYLCAARKLKLIAMNADYGFAMILLMMMCVIPATEYEKNCCRIWKKV